MDFCKFVCLLYLGPHDPDCKSLSSFEGDSEETDSREELFHYSDISFKHALLVVTTAESFRYVPGCLTKETFFSYA